MNTPTFIPVAEKRPKERTSVFLEPGSIETAAFIAKVQSAVNPERDIVSVSSVHCSRSGATHAAAHQQG
jgi:hypothetical protein